MRKFLLYIALFLVSFCITFVYTFPIDRIISYYLSKNRISYSLVEGNIFNIRIKELSTGNFIFNKIDLINRFPKIEIMINGVYTGYINIVRKRLHLSLNDFDLSSIQKNENIQGTLKADHTVIFDREILIDGKGRLFISKMKDIPISNIEINYSTKKDDHKNEIHAELIGNILNGHFKGELYLPYNIKNGYIKGKFVGKIFNGKVNREIYLKFSDLKL